MKIAREANPHSSKADTILEYPDGTKLKMNLEDYMKVGKCLTYQQQNKLIDIFEDLVIDQTEETFFIFGKVTVHWCTADCLSHPILLSIRVSDSLVKTNQKEIKSFLKGIRQFAKLQKHKDNLWYIDVASRCPFDLKACSIRCGTHFKDRSKYKRVKFIARDGYKIVAASISEGQRGNFRKIRTPKRCVKFKISCPYRIPEVSVVAIKDNGFDTLYYANGTEKNIDYRRRCFNCVDKEVVIKKVMGISIQQRLLRRKYIFGSKDYVQSLKVSGSSKKL